MPNRLIKNQRFTPDTVVIETPPQPARTVYEDRQVCGMRYSVPGRYEVVVDPRSSVASLRFFPTDGTLEGLSGVWLCDTQRVRVDYPATPGGIEAVIPVVRADSNLGWNSGARSSSVLFGDCWATFKVRRSAVGVICGLNIDDGSNEYRGNLVDFGFYCFRGQALIMENGVIKGAAGAYTDDSVFRIERSGTTVTYRVDGVLKYTHNSASTAAVWMEASLFSAGDEVFDPVMTQVGSLPTTNGATLALTLPPIAPYFTHGVNALLDLKLPPMDVDMGAGFVAPEYAVMDLNLPPLLPSFNGLTGELGALDLKLPPMDVLLADHPYAELDLQLPHMALNLQAYEGNYNASMAAAMAMTTPWTATPVLLVAMTTSGEMIAGMAADAVLDARMDTEAAMATAMTLDAIQEAFMSTVMAMRTTNGLPGDDVQTWVVNLDSLGSTSYDNYAFNSYARLGENYYGASDSGLTLLDGETDNGAPIQAAMSLGRPDFGTSTKSTIEAVYVGMAGDGNLVLKVIAEGQAYLYRTRSYSDQMQQQRFTTGKGLRTNYLELELYNENGADFEIDTLEFHLVDLTRRI